MINDTQEDKREGLLSRLEIKRKLKQSVALIETVKTYISDCGNTYKKSGNEMESDTMSMLYDSTEATQKLIDLIMQET